MNWKLPLNQPKNNSKPKGAAGKPQDCGCALSFLRLPFLNLVLGTRGHWFWLFPNLSQPGCFSNRGPLLPNGWWLHGKRSIQSHTQISYAEGFAWKGFARYFGSNTAWLNRNSQKVCVCCSPVCLGCPEVCGMLSQDRFWRTRHFPCFDQSGFQDPLVHFPFWQDKNKQTHHLLDHVR